MDIRRTTEDGEVADLGGRGVGEYFGEFEFLFNVPRFCDVIAKDHLRAAFVCLWVGYQVPIISDCTLGFPRFSWLCPSFPPSLAKLRHMAPFSQSANGNARSITRPCQSAQIWHPWRPDRHGYNKMHCVTQPHRMHQRRWLLLKPSPSDTRGRKLSGKLQNWAVGAEKAGPLGERCHSSLTLSDFVGDDSNTHGPCACAVSLLAWTLRRYCALVALGWQMPSGYRLCHVGINWVATHVQRWVWLPPSEWIPLTGEPHC